MEIMLIDFVIYFVTTVAIMCLAISYVNFEEVLKWRNLK